MKYKQSVKECRYCGDDRPPLMATTKSAPRKDGTILTYYMCRKCNADRHRGWYHLSPENKAKQLAWNAANPNTPKYLKKYWAKKKHEKNTTKAKK